MAIVNRFNSMQDAVSLSYNNLDNDSLNYFRNQYQNIINTVASPIVQNIAANYNNYISQEATERRLELAEMLAMKGVTEDGINRISYLSPDNIFNAQPIMRQYIMAHPKIYNLYKEKAINGYDDNFIRNEDSDGISEDYLAVVNGFTTEDDYTYFVDSDEADEITFSQQLAVLHTWDTALSLLEEDIDITDIDI